MVSARSRTPSPEPTPRPMLSSRSDLPEAPSSSSALPVNETTQTINERHAEAADSYVVGPMPVEKFLNFLPPKNLALMPPSAGAFDKLADGNVALELCKAITDHDRCPRFDFRYSGPESEEEMPALVCVSRGSDSVPVAKSEMYIDVQGAAQGDFMRDPPPGADRSRHQFLLLLEDAEQTGRERARQAFGRSVRWATDVCGQQFRTHFFSISLHGTSARLMRWDMGGMIASEAFDVCEYPEILCEFLWRFAHASTAERGYDPTVSPATALEEGMFKNIIAAYVNYQLDLRRNLMYILQALAHHYQPGRVAAIGIVQPDGTVARCIVSRPISKFFSLRRGGMRGYWGVMRGKVVFVKETWREWTLVKESEGAIFERLHKEGVHNIPSLVCHGDVPERTDECAAEFQYTQTDKYVNESWVCTGDRKIMVRSRMHYRLVLGTVGYPLHALRGTKELLSATFDVYSGMIYAFLHGNTLHRDVSLENIILVREGEDRLRHGYLINWELSSQMTEDKEALDEWTVVRVAPFQGASTPLMLTVPAQGTDAFMSHRLQTRMAPLRQTIRDDMESLLYVVAYCGLHWLPHRTRGAHTAAQALFHNVQVGRDGEGMTVRSMAPGEGKMENKRSRKHVNPAFFRKPFALWLQGAMDLNCPRAKCAGAIKVGDAVFPDETQWASPLPLYDFWVEFLNKHERKLHTQDRRKNFERDEADLALFSATRAVEHHTAPRPGKRKASSSPHPVERMLKRRRIVR
ncbi:hypothetical protein BKA93DRAFT_827906 [Sparassis latifolia]